MKETTSGKIAELAIKIAEIGIIEERERCISYFKECSEKIDFEGATPNEAIPILIEAMLASISDKEQS